MSLIRVQCETCQATLRVRDAGFVGEVHACPRCGSMVLIGGGAAAPTPAAEGADAEPQAEPPASSTLVMSDTLETLAAPDPTPPPTEGDPAETGPVAEPVTEEQPPALADEPLAAAAGWAPIATTVVSLLATGAILTVWMLSGPPEQTAQADPAEPALVAEPPPVDTEPAVAPTVTETEPIEVEEPPAIEPIEASEPLAESLPAEPAVSETPTTRIALAEPAREPPVATPSLPEEPVGEIDPLTFDPSEAVVILRRGVAAEPDPIEPRPADPPVPSEPDQEAPPTLDQRLAAAANGAGVFVRLAPTDAESVPFAGSAQTALTQVVPSLELRGMPLDQAVRLLGRVAGVPITLEPSALRHAGVAATQPIDLIGEDLPIASVLSQSLKPVRLAYEADGPHLATVRQGMDREREVTHRLGDLAGNDTEGLVAQLQQMVTFAGPTDLSADGTLTFTAPMATQYDLRVLCERLRLARGMRPQSKYPKRLLPTDSSLARLEPILGRRATFSFVEPTPLDEVFDHWRRATRLAILIDWRSLADAGLGPQSRLACSVTNRAWRDGLDGVLNPLGLGWTALDGKTLWVSTEAGLADLTTIEFLAVPEANAETLRADLLNRHPIAAVVYDGPSERLLVRGNAATQRDAARSAARSSATPVR